MIHIIISFFFNSLPLKLGNGSQANGKSIWLNALLNSPAAAASASVALFRARNLIASEPCGQSSSFQLSAVALAHLIATDSHSSCHRELHDESQASESIDNKCWRSAKFQIVAKAGRPAVSDKLRFEPVTLDRGAQLNGAFGCDI